METVERTKPDYESAIYFGAAATAVIALLPYINLFGLPALIVGAAVAVIKAVGILRRPVELREGAKLGFLSTWFGQLAAVLLVDVIWQFFDYQLWAKENGAATLAIFRVFSSPATMDKITASFEQAAARSFAWYMIIFQLVGATLFAGIFGVLSGVVTAAGTAKRGTRLLASASPPSAA